MIQFQGFSLSNQSLDQKKKKKIALRQRNENNTHSGLNTNYVGTELLQSNILSHFKHKIILKQVLVNSLFVLIKVFSNLIHS